MFGLKVTLTRLVSGVNISQRWLEEAENILHCKLEKLGNRPFKYLGLPIDVNPNRIKTWYPINETVRSGLTRWMNKHLSIGG